MGVYKIFNSTDLTLLFYSVYFYFPLDLRRTENKHNCTYFILYGSFLLDTHSFSFIFKKLYTSFKLNIVNFSSALHSGPPKPTEELIVHLNLQLCFMEDAEFFSFLANALQNFARYGIGGKISVTILVLILHCFQEKLMTKFFKKSKKPFLGAILGPFCPNFGKNEFSFLKKKLCQFLNIPVIYHWAKFLKPSLGFTLVSSKT